VALLFGFYVLVVVALPLSLGMLVSYRSLTRDRHCPMCGGETSQVQSLAAISLRKLWPNSPLQRRWCAHCAWVGFARIAYPILAPAFSMTSGVRVPTRGCRTEPLRMICFGGNEWRVLLQCWQEHGWNYGRLVFVGPAGRLWRDATDPFSGPTRRDVTEQALSLSDNLLTCRLKTVVTD
jgi:hypothetical protein